MIFLFLADASIAQVEIGRYWHDRDPATIYGTYRDARQALLTWDSTTAAFDLEETAAAATSGGIGDKYGINPMPPELDPWEYQQHWTMARYSTEQELIDDYEEYMRAPNGLCGPATWEPETGWIEQSAYNYLGESTKEFKHGKVHWSTYSETLDECMPNVANHHLERIRNAYCIAPRGPSSTLQACGNGTGLRLLPPSVVRRGVSRQPM